MKEVSFFPNYMEMRRRLPIGGWRPLQAAAVLAVIGVCYVLMTQPGLGLLLFWSFAVPVLPLVFLFAPGLWRNVCPLAVSNQVPRLWGFSLARDAPAWLKQYNYVIGITLFLVLASARKVIFNGSGPATAALIVGALLAAFLGGLLFKGKSGWCSSICPLLPVQRIYGQTPFVTLPNSHCQPCLGCTKNCYDFNPGVAYIADQYDDDRNYAAYRKFFAAVFPGFILAFYLVPSFPNISLSAMYGQFLLYLLVSAGAFTALDSFLRFSSVRVTTVFGALAINLYYWFNVPVFFENVGEVFGITVSPVTAPVIQIGLLLTTIAWIARTLRNEGIFLRETAAVPVTRVGAGGSRAMNRAMARDEVAVKFEPVDIRVTVKSGTTLLDVAEANNLDIEAGCRMGMCGADPVTILEGMPNLSPAESDELSTIERLGLGKNTRMACCARVKGDVVASLICDDTTPLRTSIETFAVDPEVQSVVIVGNGVAGVTTADHIRRRYPDCKIDVVGRERYHLYNRMAITRLIYGRSAMQGLMLMPETWYDERKVTCWLNTQVTRIDCKERKVHLGVGDPLPYDRLVLATGSASYVPPIPGFDNPGAFVLREAEDAMRIRAYVQEDHCRQAVVAGGGLLGLEAAYALLQLGLDVVVMERGPWLLRRQLDREAAEILRRYLQRMGMRIMFETEVIELESDGKRLRRMRVKPNQLMGCDLFLICTGIAPNKTLAEQAGIRVNRGIVVDDHMQTSDPNVFAVGDAAEHGGQIAGLWPSAVSQAEVAAVNVLGGRKSFVDLTPETMLKVAGIHLTSIGRFEQKSKEERTVVDFDAAGHSYRKLLLSDGKIVGAILVGYPQLTRAVSAAIKEGRDMSQLSSQRQSGMWSMLMGEDR